jgi:hypothetical protein
MKTFHLILSFLLINFRERGKEIFLMYINVSFLILYGNCQKRYMENQCQIKCTKTLNVLEGFQNKLR